MSQWSDRFKGSQIWTRFDELGPAIDRAVRREGIPPERVEDVERIRAVLAFVGKRFASLDPLLLAAEQLEPIAGPLGAVTEQLRSFVDNGNVEHITNANQSADVVLNAVARLNVPITPTELEGLADTASKYRATLEDELRRARESASKLREQTAALAERLTELAGELAAEKQKTAAATSEFQSQFSQAQADRSRQFDEWQSQRLTRFDALHEEIQSKFSSASESWQLQRTADEKTWKDLFEALMGKYHDSLELQSGEYKSQSDTLRRDYETEARATLERVREHEKKVIEVAGMVGSGAIMWGYMKAAGEARKSTHLWQGVAVGAMLALIAIAGWTLVHTSRGTVLEQFGGRLFAAVAIGVLATFAASQAARYAELDRRNRKLGLELEALGPYVAPLPEDEQAKFRIALGKETFGQDDQPAHDVERSPANALEAFLKSKEFRQTILEIVKGEKP